jgi:hypothetical protein
MTTTYKQISSTDEEVLRFSDSEPTCSVYRNSEEVKSWLAAGNEIQDLFEAPSGEEDHTEITPTGLYPITYNEDGTFVIPLE